MGLSSTRKTKLIAFDMSGTLRDDMDAFRRWFFFMFSVLGLDIPSPENLKRIRGECAYEVAKSFLAFKTPNPEPYVSDFLKMLDHICADYYVPKYARRLPGVADTISELVKQGFIVIIVSTGTKKIVGEFMRTENIEQYVDSLSIGSEYEPERIRIIKAQTRHGVSSRNTIYVGDSLADMRMARELGVRAIAVLTSSPSDQENMSLADHTIRNFTEVPQVLKNWEEKGYFESCDRKQGLGYDSALTPKTRSNESVSF